MGESKKHSWKKKPEDKRAHAACMLSYEAESSLNYFVVMEIKNSVSGGGGLSGCKECSWEAGKVLYLD